MVSEGEFNVVIPEISAFSFIQGCVGDAALSLFLELVLMRGGALFSPAMIVVVGSTNNVVCLLFELNKPLVLPPEEEHLASTPLPVSICTSQPLILSLISVSVCA